MELDHGYLTIARITGEPERAVAAATGASAEVMNGVGRDHGLLVHVGGGDRRRPGDGQRLALAGGLGGGGARPAAAGVLAAIGIEPGQMTREHHRAAHVVLFDRD